MDSEHAREAFYSDPAHASIKAMYSESFRRDLHKSENEFPALAEGETFGVQLNHSTTNGRNNHWVNVGYDINPDQGPEHTSVRLEIIDPVQLKLGKSALVDTIRLFEGDKVTVGSRRFPSFANVPLDAVSFWAFNMDSRKSLYTNETLYRWLSVSNENSQYGTTLFTHRDSDSNIYERFRREQEARWNQYSQQRGSRAGRTKKSPDTFRLEHTTLTAESMNSITTEVKSIVDSSPDTKTAKLRLERAFHPDRNTSMSSQESHDRYLLAHKILENLLS